MVGGFGGKISKLENERMRKLANGGSVEEFGRKRRSSEERK